MLHYFFHPPSSVSTSHFSEGVHSCKAQQITFTLYKTAESADTSTRLFNTSPNICYQDNLTSTWFLQIPEARHMVKYLPELCPA